MIWSLGLGLYSRVLESVLHVILLVNSVGNLGLGVYGFELRAVRSGRRVWGWEMRMKALGFGV